jgi:cell division protein FtsB
MNHDEFESIAALDAIGAAAPEEEQQLAAHLRECVPCRRARDEFAEAAALLAQDLPPVTPPADVRRRVLTASLPDLANDGLDDDDIDPAGRSGISPWWLAAAATMFLALWGWREMMIRVAREQSTQQRAEIETLQDEKAQLEDKNERLSAEIAALGAAETMTIALAGKEVAPSASARVFLEPGKRRAIVFFHNLPANPSDKSYQLWVIRGDQPQPMSAGVFDVTESGSATVSVENLPVSTEIKALAVTLEAKGGSAAPSNTNFYVAGDA